MWKGSNIDNSKCTCEDNSDKLGAKMSVGREMTRIGMARLKLGGHNALFRAQEMWVDVAAEVFDRSGGRVEWNEVGEDPADGTESKASSEVVHRVHGMFH